MSEKIKCKNCDTELEKKSKHCPECGVKLGETSDKKKAGAEALELIRSTAKSVNELKEKVNKAEEEGGSIFDIFRG